MWCCGSECEGENQSCDGIVPDVADDRCTVTWIAGRSMSWQYGESLHHGISFQYALQ